MFQVDLKDMLKSYILINDLLVLSLICAVDS